ncbi:hypothetical protein AV530_011918 [Patagioenas fasciata monilis]|uniref:Uncharacterized protein n=1 Tax=Patagioenas fasciata monilis TaxID=372326 RepID=A0A1V4JU66_PATFA|nr:hypothetical protein AV530_011918 [Patagioenas fasciata monilis]
MVTSATYTWGHGQQLLLQAGLPLRPAPPLDAPGRLLPLGKGKGLAHSFAGARSYVCAAFVTWLKPASFPYCCRQGCPLLAAEQDNGLNLPSNTFYRGL